MIETYTPDSSLIPAFPESEGFGAMTVGGRGGKVIEVTNLNDSGPGSLRAAIGENRPRIIIFSWLAMIKLESSLVIVNPISPLQVRQLR